MLGSDEQTGAMFSYLSPDALVPLDHPPRAIGPLANGALQRFSPRLLPPMFQVGAFRLRWETASCPAAPGF